MKPPAPSARLRVRQLALDLRCTGRAVVDRPLGAGLIVVTLAFLIGTAVAFFSLYHGARHRSHDVHEIERLLVGRLPPSVAQVIFPRLRSAGGMGFVLPGTRRVAGEVRSWAALSPGWLAAVRPRFALGGGFTDAEHVAKDGQPDRVIISDRLWRERFARSPDVVGRTLPGSDKVIAGVFAPGFVYPAHQHQPTDLWVPLREGDRSFSGPDSDVWLPVAFRLRPGVDQSAAAAEIQRLSLEVLARHPHIPPGRTVETFPFAEAGFRAEVAILRRIVLAALALVLVGCGNVGAQVLSRTLRQRREQVLHLVLGAWPGRLLGRSLLAGLAYASAGAVVAAPIAMAWLALLKRHYISAAANPGFLAAGFNGRTALFAGALVAAMALLIALPSALHLVRIRPHAGLKASMPTHGGSLATRRAREGLLAMQIALTVLLFVSADTTMSAVWRLVAGKGFDADDLVYLRVAFQGVRWRDDQVAFRDRVATRLRALAGVTAAGMVWPEPFARGVEAWTTVDFAVDGYRPGRGANQSAANRIVAGGDFFAALRIPLVRGRLPRTGPGRPGPREVLVDQTLVDKILNRRDLVGRVIYLGDGREPHVVAGVVGAAMFSPAPGVRAFGTIYIPHDNSPADPSVTFVVRTGRAPAAIVPELRRAVQEVDPRRRIVAAGPYQELIVDSLLGTVGEALLSSAFGLVALLLATLGLYSVAVALVVSRTGEIAVRMAIGSPRGRILRLILGQGLRPLAAGLLLAALGLAAGLQIPAVRQLLLQGNPLEWPSVAGAAALVSLAGLLVLLPPAWRASRLPLLGALRSE